METCLQLPDALDTVNKWCDQGHQICFFTSSKEAHRVVTKSWLNKHDLKYHSILTGKQEAETTIGSIIT